VSQENRALGDLLNFRSYFADSRAAEPITVDVVRQIDEDVARAAERLVPQLSPTSAVPGPWELDQMIKDPGTTLIVARERHVVVGMLTLHTFRAMTGIHAWIQDVVIDPVVKGRGVSELLTREAVRLSEQRGTRTTEITSRPSQAGHARLYERLGFERRETHHYRYRLSS
jgi:ribosomal protein S18 acetylase RimI-like enzyme